jgi:phenylacetate-CoA ligase
VHLGRRGIPVPPVPFMFGGGEALTAAARRTLQRALGGRVVDRYAATDWGLIATECRFGRLHLMPAFVHLEILDGESPALPGVVGDVVVTNLLSAARPIVRVRTGDRAATATKGCTCGNRAPCLAFVAGRRDEAVLLPDGRRIAWPEIDAAFLPEDTTVLGWQADQIGTRDVVVRVAVIDGAVPPRGLESRLGERLPGMRVEVVADDAFHLEANGKTRAIVGCVELGLDNATNDC